MTQSAAYELLSGFGIEPNRLLALEALTTESDACVFVAGSLVDGLGNRCSDIDVFVIGAGSPRGESLHRAGEARFSVHMYGTRRVDFEYWSEPAVRTLATTLRELTIEDAGPDNILLERRLNAEQIAFMHRLRTGLPLLQAQRFQRVRAQFEFERLSRYLTEVKLREIDDALEDLCGMVDDSDIDVGLLRARDLLDAVCDAYCHHLGDTNIRRKWRTKILNALGDRPHARELHEQFWALQYPAAPELRAHSERYRAYVEQCMALANRVTDWIVG